MNATEKRHNWTEFLKLFTRQNLARPTRISVYEGAPEEMRDYWLEEGLPLAGLDVDKGRADAPTIEILLGDAAKENHLTHVIVNARFLKIVLSASNEADGLEITDAEGRTTVLHFENFKES